MAEKTRCENCDRTFKDLAGLTAHNLAKHSKPVLNQKKLNLNKIYKPLIFIGILAVLIWGVIALIPDNPSLPPTTMEGHREINPPFHISKKPFSIVVQKHMLEHADGIEGGRPGVIINYNCEDYECETDLIEKLEKFALESTYIYVAPFEGMEAKIAMTSLGKIELLDQYDESKIKSFIGVN